jgi:diguanylate cyclase (GGDEF)-like protein/PAS domain S-box-containing protein
MDSLRPDNPASIPNESSVLHPISSATHSDSFHSRLLDSLYDGVYFVDAERRITYWNKGAERLTGYTAAEAMGKHCFDNFLMHVDDGGSQLCLLGCPLSMTIADGELREAQVFLRHKLGHRVPVSVRASPIRDQRGAVIGAVEVFSDSTAIRTLQKRTIELEALAYTDALTEVANRRYIDLKVQQAIQEIELFNRPYGIILMDINDFKGINDTHGHTCGDLVLKAVCETLSTCMRPSDLMGRWGGDELLLLARDVTASSLQQLANRCRQLVAGLSIPAGGNRLKLTVSLGSTLLRKGETTETAFARADQFLYADKQNGTSTR